MISEATVSPQNPTLPTSDAWNDFKETQSIFMSQVQTKGDTQRSFNSSLQRWENKDIERLILYTKKENELQPYSHTRPQN